MEHSYILEKVRFTDSIIGNKTPRLEKDHPKEGMPLNPFETLEELQEEEEEKEREKESEIEFEHERHWTNEEEKFERSVFNSEKPGPTVLKSHERIEKYEDYETYRPSFPTENRNPNTKKSKCRRKERYEKKKEEPVTKSYSDIHIIRAKLEKKLNSVLNISADLYNDNSQARQEKEESESNCHRGQRKK